MSESLRTLIVATLLLVLICLGWFFLLYRPGVSKVTTISEDSKELLAKLQSFHVSDGQIKALEKQVEILKRDIRLKKAKIVPKDELSTVVRQFQQKGRGFGLKFHSIIPDYESLIRVENEERESGSEVLKLTVHIKLQGSYRSFGRFLDSLDEFPFLISLAEMNVMYNSSIFPELDILLDIVLYLRE